MSALKKYNLDHLYKLKEMGLNPEIEEVNGELLMRLTDAEGVSTELPFVREEHLYKNQKGYVPASTFIPERWRGKGVATEAYKAIENMTGLPIFPDNEQTPSGYGLHEAKGYGKEFGLSEKELESKLMPSEKLERNARKKALVDTLMDAAEKADKGESYENLQGGLFPKIKEQLSGKEKTNILTVSRNGLLDSFRNQTEGTFGDTLRKNIPKYASKVKAIPLVGPALGAAAALATGEANAASVLPILGEAESLAPSAEDAIIENPQASPAARRAALEKLLKK